MRTPGETAAPRLKRNRAQAVRRESRGSQEARAEGKGGGGRPLSGGGARAAEELR